MPTQGTTNLGYGHPRRRRFQHGVHGLPRALDARRRIGAFLVLAGLAMPMAAQEAGIGHIETTRTQAVDYRPEFRGYARVDPVSLVTVKAGLDGVIEDLTARPGQQLSAGDIIAHIGGPDQVKARADAEVQLSAAKQTLVEASDAEKAVRDTYRRKLADRAQMDRVKAELAAAQVHVAEAKAELTELEALGSVESPISGRIVSLSAATGDRVARDGPVLVIQPDHDLWIRAVFYDMPTELLTPGYPGRFLPANGSSELPLRFAQRLPSLRPDGGLTAFFETTSSAPGWSGGEAGEVVVAGEQRSAVAIPTTALILDRSRWWVLVQTADGLRRQAVEPGQSRGEKTLVLDGLAAGDAVVVRDAYLLFHRDFGQHYTPPD